MNNEPVAWMGIRRHGETRVSIEKLANDDIPLYTHSVNTCKHGVDDGACKECYQEVTHPAKELTDKVIIDIALKEVDGWVTKEHLKNFARAILRKASEK